MAKRPTYNDRQALPAITGWRSTTTPISRRRLLPSSRHDGAHRLLWHHDLAGGKSEDKEYYERAARALVRRWRSARRMPSALSIKDKMVEFMLDKLNVESRTARTRASPSGASTSSWRMTKIEGMAALRDMTDDFYLFDEETGTRVKGREHRAQRPDARATQARIRVGAEGPTCSGKTSSISTRSPRTTSIRRMRDAGSSSARAGRPSDE